MKTIKYRQFFANKFHYWGYLEGEGFVSPLTTAEAHDIKSEQFTGLYDKNGKEIYEGDIVSFGKDNAFKQVVEWKTWPGNDSDIVGYNFSQAEADSMEVIGNVYENPELLSPLNHLDSGIK